MFMPISDDAYFISLKYSTNLNQESILEFEIDHLRISLCLPYILDIYKFVMDAINTDKPDASVKQKQTETTKKKLQIEENTNEAIQVGSLRAKANINLPVVVLFSEPEKSNSKILLMKVILLFIPFIIQL
jgi:hypothetical protein